MNSYLNLLKKENFLLPKNQGTNNSQILSSFGFLTKTNKTKRYTSDSRSIYLWDKKIRRKKMLRINCDAYASKEIQKNEEREEVSSSLEFNIKQKKIYDLNFIKKLNRLNFLLKNNATNKWVNWVNNFHFDSIGKEENFLNFITPKFKLKNDIKDYSKKRSKPKKIYKSGYSKIHELKLVSVEIASSEKIKEWAEKILPNGKTFGEVTNANTLHYKTFKPHKGGLFCERIFGPLKDFECACGVRSKPVPLESSIAFEQKKRFFCINCDVEYTWSVIRRYQLGYIQLISPVSHIWFLKANPSYLSLLLDFRRSHLESIIYCTESITLENLWKSSQTLGLDTSPSTLYSIWQKLLEEEKFLKRKHAISFFDSNKNNRTRIEEKEGKKKSDQKISKNRNILIFSLLKKNKNRLKLIDSYKQNKEFFYKKKNIIYDYSRKLKNSSKNKNQSSFVFLNNKIVSNNKSLFFAKFSENNYFQIYKKTFFQVLLLSKKSFLLSLKIFFSKFLKMQKISKILEKDYYLEKFKENFLFLTESFFQIYFTELYLKDKNLIIKMPSHILQFLCENFIFYFIQIQFQFYALKNPLNNLPQFSNKNERVNVDKSQFSNLNFTFQSNSINKLFLKKIKEGNNKIFKIFSKIQKGIHSMKGLFYYTGICLFKKQIKLNKFFKENENALKSNIYKREIDGKKKDDDGAIENERTNNKLWDNIDLKSDELEYNSEKLQILKILETKKQTNLLKTLISKILSEHDFLSQQKKRRNVFNILYLFYAFFRKEMISIINNVPEYKKENMFNEIYFLSTLNIKFHIKNPKSKFSEIVNFHYKFKNLLLEPLFISCYFSNKDSTIKQYKLTNKLNIAEKILDKKNINTRIYNLNKKKNLNKRKKFLFLQKQKSLILRNPQFFSSIYSKKTHNNKNEPLIFRFAEKALPMYNTDEKEIPKKMEEWQVPLQKKMLKNDLYTISYSHLWPIFSDWKSFFYYNSAPKDFEDSNIYYSYRKSSFSTKTNKFSSKLDIASLDSSLFNFFVNKTEEIDPNYSNTLANSKKQILLKTFVNNSSKAKVTRTTEFLSNIKSPLAGAAIVKKLLSEYTPSELKKMVKQHQILLPKLNHNIRQLKEKAIKKFDFVKIQKLLNKRDHIIRRLKLIRKFSRKNVEPTSMILSVLPVLPPDLRPILKLQNQIAASDLNRLYQRILYRNERLKKFLKDPSTSQSFEMKYAQRLLQEAVDNLIQNGKGNVKPETNSRGQALKSLSEILKGKQGRFRQYLLGKRVDYSGRSVIVVGPKLKLYECGLPKEMAIELFLPFLIKRILHYKIARTVIGAKNFLYSNKTYCINLLNEIMTNHPVLLNRAPTLHRLGIQAFQPKLVEGRAILLHPLVCPAFNADFDGDQMAVHLPITVEARAEAWNLIFSRNHLISPATGDPIVLPSQDMVLGCYYLTSEKKILNIRLSNLITERGSENYSNITNCSNLYNARKVLNAYQRGQILLQSIVWIKWNGKIFMTEPLSMIEIRLNRYGVRDQIQSKSYKRIDKEENILNKYIRTTPGRILINSITQKCILL